MIFSSRMIFYLVFYLNIDIILWSKMPSTIPIIIQWWKPKQRRIWFCLFLINPCYDSKTKHIEFWLEVSKVLHLSINPVSWLFTMLGWFLPEKAENSLIVKDCFFAKNDYRNIWEYSIASNMIWLWLFIE